jgi:VIT1/CCC1 family predicted Fe2+/Mn2+ transporter
MPREIPRLLDPIDRVAEILFGLIMAVTIIGALSVADAGRAEIRSVLAAAIACNIAWGLVDAVMYVVRALTDGARRANRGEGDASPILTARLFAEAFAVFVMVVLGTFPVVIPFLLIDDGVLAMRVARAVTIALLFVAGFQLARHAGSPRPMLAGVGAALFGAALIVAVMALGG